MKALRELTRFLAPYRVIAILAPLMMLIEVSMDLMQPRMMQRIIDQGIAKNDLNVVITTGMTMVGFAVLGMTGGVMCSFFAVRASQRFGADVRLALFRKIQTLSFSNLDRLETGSLITRLTNDVTQTTEAVQMAMRVMVRAPLLVVGSTVMAIYTSPRLAMLYLALVPAVFLVIAYASKRAFPLFTEVQRRVDKLNGIMQENLAGVRVVKAFARHEHEIARFGAGNDDLRSTTLRALRIMVTVMPMMSLIINTGLALGLWFGGNLIFSGRLDVGGLVAFTNYMTQTLFGLMTVTMVLIRFTSAEASADRINEVLHTEPDIVAPVTPLADFRPRGEIRFENVTFRYTPDSAPVLRNASFTIPAGSVFAILGTTGSGKSSLIGLIPRFYDVDEGRILIDGVDVREIPDDQLRSMIAIALQETVLFSGSIRENIRFGRPEATEEEVIAAAKAAQANDFINEQPEGYDTHLGQRGVNLSGGQKQRISIARALIRQAPILILDDSTSAVDVATERRIQEALAKLDQTCVIVAQRISAVVNADQIIVLDGGRISARGTHDELMETSTVYRDIYESQMENGAAYGAA